MKDEKIWFYASLERPFECTYSELAVRLVPRDYIVWDSRLQDEVDIYIPISEFIDKFPEEWRTLNHEWERQLDAGVPAEMVEAEIELPISVVTKDRNLSLIPLNRVEEHLSFIRIVEAVRSGVWITSDGREIELDADESPLRRMGMI